MNKRKICFTDIDGTLTKKPLHVLLCMYAAKNGAIPNKMVYGDNGVIDVQNAYASGKIKGNYNAELVRTVKKLRNYVGSKNAIDELYSDFAKHSDIIYDFTQIILDEVYDEHDIVAVSKSDLDLIKALFADTGYFKDWIATRFYRHENGEWDVRSNLATKDKGRVVREYMKHHKYSFRGSVAIGDSRHDMNMLNLVEIPIIVEPTADILKDALEYRWNMFVLAHGLDEPEAREEEARAEMVRFLTKGHNNRSCKRSA